MNSPAPDRNNQERITAAFILLTPVMCEALFAYTFYGNLVPNDFWVFVGVGLKRGGPAGCKALDVGSACCDDSILFAKPPDREKHLTRLFLSVAGGNEIADVGKSLGDRPGVPQPDKSQLRC